MYSHVFIGIAHFERALAFYRPLMSHLGLTERFCEPQRPWAGWQMAGADRPLFVISRPHEGTHAPGNGQMVAFLAHNRAHVRELHALALAHGGHNEGAPGLRTHYHALYYGAYVRDPEGNKIAFAFHGQPAQDGAD